MEDVKSHIISTPLLRVLDVLLRNPGVALADSEIAGRVVGVRRSAVHLALTTLHRLGIVQRSRAGRRCVNSVDPSHAWLAPFKIALNLLALGPLVEGLKPCSSRIVLFGSTASGTNREESDVDLLIVSSDAGSVLRAIDASGLAERVQAIIKTPAEMLEFDAKEPVLLQEIRKGVTLWER